MVFPIPEPIGRKPSNQRGFILIILVGMLAVLVILGLSFAEQGRMELTGAANSRDLGAMDTLAETGFQMALGALANDTNVYSNKTKTGWDSKTKGAGWTSRWGYSTYWHRTPKNGGTATPAPSLSEPGPAFNREDERNYLNSWQMPFWNEERKPAFDMTKGLGPFVYRFYFQMPTDYQNNPKDDPAEQTRKASRHPSELNVLLDSVQLQPMARVRRFRFKTGASRGFIQVAISPRDGGINLNDVKTANGVASVPLDERFGVHDFYPVSVGGLGASAGTVDDLASPDRRTMEYILGKRPEWANRQYESAARWGLSDPRGREPHTQDRANLPSGNRLHDDGIYNFRSYFEPMGRVGDGGTSTKWRSYYYAHRGIGRLYNKKKEHPTIFYNSNSNKFWRYNFEAPRYVLWAPSMGMSLRRMGYDKNRENKLTWLTGRPNNKDTYFWYPPGRMMGKPAANNEFYGNWGYWKWREPVTPDVQFKGFGFDLLNPKRGGVGVVKDEGHRYISIYKKTQYPWVTDPKIAAERHRHYSGAGIYGHPKPRSFQLHMVARVAQGRFWSDLMANWYFGGAPGYTNQLGSVRGEPSSGSSYSNWTHLGSSYDSVALGSNWMPPTMHVWHAGFWGKGRLTVEDTDRGMTQYAGNMPPVMEAATYSYPAPRYLDDWPMANAQFLFNDVRVGIRAYGIQENWGLFDESPSSETPGRMYDAININTTNFMVVYGLLTPEKIPSMLNRTVVAPHLHWKARYLDAAYDGMGEFKRYLPYDSSLPQPTAPYNPTKAIKYNPNVPPVDLTPFSALVGAALTAKQEELAKERDDNFFKDKLFFGHLKDENLPYSDTNKVFDLTAVPPYDFRYNPDNRDDPATPDDENLVIVGAIDPSLQPRNLSKMWIGPSDLRTSIHRHIEPHPFDGVTPKFDDEELRIFGKMDFKTPDPRTGAAADDVFTDCHYDMYLYEAQISRPDKRSNWADFFSQRLVDLPQLTALAQQPGDTRKGEDDTLVLAEGYSCEPAVLGSPRMLKGASEVQPVPHPIWGLPNPDYSLLQPGMILNAEKGAKVSYGTKDLKNEFWANTFQRYFPMGTRAPSIEKKMYDTVSYDKNIDTNDSAATALDRVDPKIPVGKVPDGNYTHLDINDLEAKLPDNRSDSRFVPAIGPDEGWRLTRIGRKYQEIIADEMMDYQMNPWWPNPVIHLQPDPGGSFSDQDESVPVPNYSQPKVGAGYGGYPTRLGHGTLAEPQMGAFQAHGGKANYAQRVPPYYAYFNRFWVRAVSKFPRSTLSISADELGIEYRATPAVGKNLNFTENRGFIPQAYSYYGQAKHVDDKFVDKVKDFPFNNLEDAMGSEWRYLSGNFPSTSIGGMTSAPARNHPFKNWADFVAFLGHLVYRSPMAATARDPVAGVDAWRACHSAESWVDSRNKGQFFDGSKIVDGDGGPALADSLQGNKGGRKWTQSVVAVDGSWPISGNFGAYPDPMDINDPIYPKPPNAGSDWTAEPVEWKRRIDELRGRDEAGLRIEHHYISEKAANDVLVSFSNGRVGPIDFDGDGHVTMTQRKDLHFYPSAANASDATKDTDAKKHKWLVPRGYPWHKLTGTANSVVENEEKPGVAYNSDVTDKDYGIKKPDQWEKTNKSEIIQGCVTLPIKFRSNTFRVTVVVELTDVRWKTIIATRRFSRTYSRVPEKVESGAGVQGKYTGKFILHGQKVIAGADPDLFFTGVP